MLTELHERLILMEGKTISTMPRVVSGFLHTGEAYYYMWAGYSM